MRLRERVGIRLRELRKEAELSALALAARAQMSRNFLTAIEKGKRAATVDTLEKLAVALGVEPVELFQPAAANEPSPRDAPVPQQPEDRLGRRIADFARGTSRTKMNRFEKMARLYFREDEDEGSSSRSG